MSSGSATNVVGECGLDDCLITSSFFCSSCHLVKYCSKGHQIADWKNHRKVCSPLTLQSSTDLGRHYVASRNLKAGTLLLSEYPVLVQPLAYTCQKDDFNKISQIQEEEKETDEEDEEGEVKLNSNPVGLRVSLGPGQGSSVCLACCMPMPADGKKCPKCDWPICSIKCSEAKIHADNECSIFVKNSFKMDQMDQDILDGVFFIRGMLLKKSQPELWDKIQEFQSKSSNKTAVFKENELFPPMVSRFQEKFKKLEQDFGEDFVNTDELVKLYRIQCRNVFAHDVDHEEQPGKIKAGTGAGILYLKSSMFSHGCFPNCSWGVTCGPVFKIEIRTAIDIVKGQILSINYYPTDLMMGSMKLNLSEMKVGKFKCYCARCVDPTELNSMISAVKCTTNKGDCTNGYLIPKDPKNLSSFSIWACTVCGDKSTETWERINHLTKRAEIETKKFADFEPKKIEDMLNLLRKHLHPNHWVIQQFCQQVMLQIALASSKKDNDEDYYLKITRYMEQVTQLMLPGLSYHKSQIQHLLFKALEAKCYRSRNNKDQLVEFAHESSKILDQLLKVKKLDPSSRTVDGQWTQDVMKLMETRVELDFILLNINLIHIYI